MSATHVYDRIFDLFIINNFNISKLSVSDIVLSHHQLLPLQLVPSGTPTQASFLQLSTAWALIQWSCHLVTVSQPWHPHSPPYPVEIPWSICIAIALHTLNSNTASWINHPFSTGSFLGSKHVISLFETKKEKTNHLNSTIPNLTLSFYSKS